MKYLPLLVAAALLLSSCKKKKQKEEGKGLVPITSLFKKEVEHIDTSLYSIVKVVSTDSTRNDTTYIPREKFAEEVKEFLNLPDFSDPKVAKRFKEENRYDTLMGRVILTYTPIDPKNETISKVELLVSSTDITPEGDNKVTNIIIDQAKTDRNGSWTKQMLWTIGKKILITATEQKPGKPEQLTITKLTWNDDE